MFSSFSLITNFYRTNGQYYSYDEEQQSADNSGSNGLVFNSSRYGKFYFFAIFKTFQRVSDHSEIIGTTSD